MRVRKVVKIVLGLLVASSRACRCARHGQGLFRFTGLARLLIVGSFLSMHVMCRNYVDQLAAITKGKADVQASSVDSFPERVIARLGLAMRRVGQHQHRSAENHLIGLCHVHRSSASCRGM